MSQDTEIVEIMRSLDAEEDESATYTALAYGKHSLYDYTVPVYDRVDVKDVLLDHYVGRHSAAGLIQRGRYPVYVDEIETRLKWRSQASRR